MEKYLDLDWLWANKTMVHYFGLGFIQLKINDSQRVHFYTEKLMKTVGDEEIHNHRYHFVSKILKGTFSQSIYDVIPGDSHFLKKEDCSRDSESAFQIPELVGIVKLYDQTVNAGEDYFMDHNTFHTVESKDAITFLTRTDYKKELADVVYPRGASSRCPFSVNLTEDEIFDILKKLINE